MKGSQAVRAARPQSSFFPVSPAPSSSHLPALPPSAKPLSSHWFTARPSLSLTQSSLLRSLSLSRAHLYNSGVLPSISAPLPSFLPSTADAAATTQSSRRRWKDIDTMGTYLREGVSLRRSQYKGLTKVLGQIEGLVPLARLADKFDSQHVPRLEVDPLAKITPNSTGSTSRDGGSTSLQAQLEELLANFKEEQAKDSLGRSVERVVGKDRRLGAMDALGRIRAVGKRKESAARVWIVPANPPTTSSSATSTSPSSTSSTNDLPVPGQVLVNGVPLPTYFPQPDQRAFVLKPLGLCNVLGSFNVFVLARGGGLSAQAEAVGMGIARALVEYERIELEKVKELTLAKEEEVEVAATEYRDILKKAKLLERDPRMVERKKTGQPKSRKKNAWVKR